MCPSCNRRLGGGGGWNVSARETLAAGVEAGVEAGGGAGGAEGSASRFARRGRDPGPGRPACGGLSPSLLHSRCRCGAVGRGPRGGHSLVPPFSLAFPQFWRRLPRCLMGRGFLCGRLRGKGRQREVRGTLTLEAGPVRGALAGWDAMGWDGRCARSSRPALPCPALPRRGADRTGRTRGCRAGVPFGRNRFEAL